MRCRLNNCVINYITVFLYKLICTTLIRFHKYIRLPSHFTVPVVASIIKKFESDMLSVANRKMTRYKDQANFSADTTATAYLKYQTQIYQL